MECGVCGDDVVALLFVLFFFTPEGFGPHPLIRVFVHFTSFVIAPITSRFRGKRPFQFNSYFSLAYFPRHIKLLRIIGERVLSDDNHVGFFGSGGKE